MGLTVLCYLTTMLFLTKTGGTLLVLSSNAEQSIRVGILVTIFDISILGDNAAPQTSQQVIVFRDFHLSSSLNYQKCELLLFILRSN